VNSRGRSRPWRHESPRPLGTVELPINPAVNCTGRYEGPWLYCVPETRLSETSRGMFGSLRRQYNTSDYLTISGSDVIVTWVVRGEMAYKVVVSNAAENRALAWDSNHHRRSLHSHYALPT
jgi:hypothetical protein